MSQSLLANPTYEQAEQLDVGDHCRFTKGAAEIEGEVIEKEQMGRMYKLTFENDNEETFMWETLPDGYGRVYR